MSDCQKIVNSNAWTDQLSWVCAGDTPVLPILWTGWKEQVCFFNNCIEKNQNKTHFELPNFWQKVAKNGLLGGMEG